MAQLLTPELLAAQSATIRQPIVEVKLGEWKNPIPLAGQFLDNNENAETSPFLMSHSSGSLFLPFVVQTPEPVNYTLMLAYTDADRTLWQEAVLVPSSRTEILCPVAIQIPNSQNVCVYYLSANAIGIRLNQVIVSAAGLVVSGPTVLTEYLAGPITSLSIVWTGNQYVAAYVQNGVLQTMSSMDGTTWTAGSAISNSGISGPLTNCSVCYVGGDLLIWFDVNDTYKVWNLYYVVSQDGGEVTAPVKVTSFTTPSTIGKQPFLFAKSVHEILAAYDEIRSSLHMDNGNPAWPSGLSANVGNLHFDTVNRQLYAVCNNTFVGSPKFYGVLRIDVDSWTISGFWSTETTPGFSTVHTTSGHFPKTMGIMQGDGQYVTIFSTWNNFFCISVLDGVGDSITNYVWGYSTEYNLSENISGITPPISGAYTLIWTKVDISTQRLYLAFMNNYYYQREIHVGYVDYLKQSTTYGYSSIIAEINMVDAYQVVIAPTIGIDDASGLLWISYGQPVLGSTGRLRVYLLGGSLLTEYTHAKFTEFPINGLSSVACLHGVLYGGFTYSSSGSQSALRGLCAIDTATGNITYLVPLFQTDDDLQIGQLIATKDYKIVFTCRYGIGVYSLANGFALYKDATISGLYPGSDTPSWNGPLAYDLVNTMIFSASNPSNAYRGILAFSTAGNLVTSYYFDILRTTPGEYNIPPPTPLVIGEQDGSTAIAVTPNGDLYAAWLEGTRIKWDSAIGELDVTPYLVRGQDVTLTLNMDNQPGQMSFTLANGQLFDWLNTSSLYSKWAQKGKKASLRFGEMVNGTPYWQPGRYQYVITDANVSGYKRGEAPLLSVTAEDLRTLYKEGTIVATPYFDVTLPDQAIITLLTEYGKLQPNEINVQSFTEGQAVGQQWLDKALLDIINDILNRWGYFAYINPADNCFTTRKIDLSAKNPDHIYAGLDWLIEIKPDSSYTEFTTQVTVIGQGQEQIAVTSSEERVRGISGTIGWWKRKQTQVIWYSEDQSKTCTNVRLQVNESATNIAFKLAGNVKEAITYVDPNHHYCEVTITTPNMIPLLLTAFAMYEQATAHPPSTAVVGVGGGTLQPPAMSKLEAIEKDVAMMLIMNILGSVCSYNYDIYATPIGYVYQTFEATAVDSNFQAQLGGRVIEKRIDEPLCHSVAACQAVADYELALIQAQRRKLTVTKTANLQDEPGDRVQIIHPYSQQPLTVLIVSLTRKFHIPALGAGEQGGFIDEWEAWKV